MDANWIDANDRIQSTTTMSWAGSPDGPEGSYARVQPLFFSLNNGADSTISMNSPTSYNQSALWDAAKNWFNNNGPAPVGPFVQGTAKKNVQGGYLDWKLWESKVDPSPDDRWMPMNMTDFLTPYVPETFTFGLRWGNNEVVELGQYLDGAPVAKMPSIQTRGGRVDGGCQEKRAPQRGRQARC